MDREEADKIQIEEQTQVGRAECAGDVVAENLTRWAYRRLQTWPDMLHALRRAYFILENNNIQDDYFDVLRIKLGDLLPSDVCKLEEYIKTGKITN